MDVINNTLFDCRDRHVAKVDRLLNHTAVVTYSPINCPRRSYTNLISLQLNASLERTPSTLIINSMATTTLTDFRFPWREGNAFRLLLDGDQFFPVMLSAIDSADTYLALNMYLMSSGSVADRFIDALLRAAQRGVSIHIILDDYGASSLQTKDRERLNHKNIHLTFYNPIRYGDWFNNLFRDHRKLLLLDGRVAFVGGVGITDDFDPIDNKALRWRETVIEIKGPCVDDWRSLFVESWPIQDTTPILPSCPSLYQGQAPDSEQSPNQIGRVTRSQATTRQEIRRSVNRHLHGAEHRVWIATAYFVPSWRMHRALRKAALRGVDVRLLLPGEHTDHPAIRHAGRRFYYKLLLSGVRIFEYQPRFSHSKIMLCDQWSTIGSSNFDRWNLVWNLEANQEIDDSDFARSVKQLFNDDFKQCAEIELKAWCERPWHRRCLEWYWGWIDALLYRFSMHWRRRHRARHRTDQQKKNS